MISSYFNNNASLAPFLAPRKEAKLFSAETMHGSRAPLGVHKVFFIFLIFFVSFFVSFFLFWFYLGYCLSNLQLLTDLGI